MQSLQDAEKALRFADHLGSRCVWGERKGENLFGEVDETFKAKGRPPLRVMAITMHLLLTLILSTQPLPQSSLSSCLALR